MGIVTVNPNRADGKWVGTGFARIPLVDYLTAGRNTYRYNFGSVVSDDLNVRDTVTVLLDGQQGTQEGTFRVVRTFTQNGVRRAWLEAC